MFESGLAAMNGFCGAIVGLAISFAMAGPPENAGRVGVPTGTIGSAAAGAAEIARAATASDAIRRLIAAKLSPPPPPRADRSVEGAVTRAEAE